MVIYTVVVTGLSLLLLGWETVSGSHTHPNLNMTDDGFDDVDEHATPDLSDVIAVVAIEVALITATILMVLFVFSLATYCAITRLYLNCRADQDDGIVDKTLTEYVDLGRNPDSAVGFTNLTFEDPSVGAHQPNEHRPPIAVELSLHRHDQEKGDPNLSRQVPTGPRQKSSVTLQVQVHEETGDVQYDQSAMVTVPPDHDPRHKP